MCCMGESGGMSERQRRAVEHFLALEDEQAKQPSPAGPPPGWYTDPRMADTRRYWDGSTWTNHVAPIEPPVRVVETPERADNGGLIAGGVVAAILIPFIGFIIGIVLLAKERPGPGLAVMGLSFFAFLFWFQALVTSPGYTG